MDQQFLEREKELFVLNAKLNAKTKKFQVNASNKVQTKPIQIHTANNNFNFYEESRSTTQDDGLELMCKKINIADHPTKRPHEIVYPLFNRQTKAPRERNLDLHIHLPTGSMISDGKCELQEVEIKSETIESISFKNESMLTRFSEESSAIPPADPIPNLPMPINVTDVIPKSLDKKNVSNDGLLK